MAAYAHPGDTNGVDASVISFSPMPGDIEIAIRAQPDAALGFVEVDVTQHTLQGTSYAVMTMDEASYVQLLRKTAQHLTSYADGYERAMIQEADLLN